MSAGAAFGAVGTGLDGALPLPQVRHRGRQRHRGQPGGACTSATSTCLTSIEAGYNKPYCSLALAIALATLNNFTWNRLVDLVRPGQDARKRARCQPVSLRLLGMEFGQYVTASAFGSGLQYVPDAAAIWQHGLPPGKHHRHRGRQREQLSGQRPLDLQRKRD